MARYDRHVTGLSSEAAEVILRHGWPGNVREMEHAMHRAVLMARGSEVSGADLMLRTRGDGDAGELEGLTLDEVERRLIEKALERHEWNVSRAAEQLGLSRSALYRRLQELETAHPELATGDSPTGQVIRMTLPSQSAFL